MGTRGSEKQRASCAPSFGSRRCSALDPRVPVCRGEGMTKQPAGSARWIAPIPLLHTDVQLAELGMPSRTGAHSAEGAASGVHFFWLLFFGQTKKSDPRVGRARKSERTRSVVRRNQKPEQSRWIPAGACRNDERKLMSNQTRCACGRKPNCISSPITTNSAPALSASDQ